jgi:hypothetical protein
MSLAAALHPVRAWNRFWFAPISARPLGAFRIVFGLLVLFHLALLWPEADIWLSDAGYLRGTEARELAGPLRWSPLQVWQSPAVAHAALAGTAMLAALLTVGWHTRAVAVGLYAALLSIHHRNLLTASGADVLLMIVAFWLMFAPCGAAFSIDERRRAQRLGGESDRIIVPWAQRMIQLQVALVYFITAAMKACGGLWRDGTALYYVLSNGEARRWTLGLTGSREAIMVLTYTALVVEFALPLLLWFRRTRPWIILAGLALHGGILLTVNIPVFGELITACYLLFLTPEELNTFLRWIDPRTWFRGVPAVQSSPTPKAGAARPHFGPDAAAAAPPARTR